MIIPCKGYTFDMTIGATTWYAWYSQEDEEETIKPDPIFFYGPALSVKINDDFNLTFVYLYGRFNYSNAGFDFKMKRIDSDLALNYKLNEYFKVFGGIKYIGYSADVLFFSTKIYLFGPGLGLSATYPIVGDLFLLANLSGIYLWGYSEVVGFTGKEKLEYNTYGINSSLSLAYYIAPASTVISLGGRYQCLMSNDDSNNRTKFYGITLSATYSFSI